MTKFMRKIVRIHLQLEKKIVTTKVKAIIIDEPHLNKKKIKKLSQNYPVILILDYYLQVSNTLRICLHPRIEEYFLSGFEYFPLHKKTVSNKEKKIKILIAFGNVDSKELTEKSY